MWYTVSMKRLYKSLTLKEENFMKKKNNFKALRLVTILKLLWCLTAITIEQIGLIYIFNNFSKFLEMDTIHMILFSAKCFIAIIVFAVIFLNILYCIAALEYKIQNNVTFKEAWKQACIDNDCTPDEQQNQDDTID